ncbi:MAG: Hpt domain-containing protein [Spirochaeta sp.]
MNQYLHRYEKFVAKFAGHEEVVRRMAGMFLSDAPQRLEQISTASELRDWEGVMSAAHSLVNIAGTMQAFEAAEQARKLEAAVRARAYHEIPELTDRLDQHLQNALQVLKDYQQNGHYCCTESV